MAFTTTSKRVSVSLSDDEINLLHAAVLAYGEDIGVCGDDEPEGLNDLKQKLLRARKRVRRI